MEFNQKISSFKKRQLGILVDNTKRSILFAAAEEIKLEDVNLAIRVCSNNLYVALSPERSNALMLAPMSRPITSVGKSAESKGIRPALNMCVSVEAREGVTTGISAADRMHTIRVLGEKNPSPRKLIKPGHIFPVEVREGGVLVNHALPEGAVDIVKLAGFSDAALFSEILNVQGEFSDQKELEDISKKINIPIFYLSEITQYRLENEKLITRIAEAKLPTAEAGVLKAIIYKSKIHEGEHLALVKGEITPDAPVLTRIQVESTFTDVFGGNNPASRKSLKLSLSELGKAPCGVFIYLRRPFRGVLKEQISNLADSSKSNVSTVREYGIGSQILLDIGARKIELLTNSPKDYSGVKSFGIEIISQKLLKVV